MRRLVLLRNAGHPVTTAVFPDAEHGLYEFEKGPDGERLSTRQPDGYFDMMRDFINAKVLASGYGNAEMSDGQP
ncbi:hypothetical protein [Pseudoxanthomonas wuyuanensis]|uniref:hypothetical protein n=1 Tax=Pseudoxanthomonas wuyuanensis TaxID=1073196 RepID=UPI001C3F125F|nr:hypothetical protein [Pseudoxanthomonas wuyuanensis]